MTDEPTGISADYLRSLRLKERSYENERWKQHMDEIYTRRGMKQEVESTLNPPGIEPTFGVNNPPLQSRFEDIIKSRWPDVPEPPVDPENPPVFPEPPPPKPPVQADPDVGVLPEAPPLGAPPAQQEDPNKKLFEALDKRAEEIRKSASPPPISFSDEDDFSPPLNVSELGLPADTVIQKVPKANLDIATAVEYERQNTTASEVVTELANLFPEVAEEPGKTLAGPQTTTIYDLKTEQVPDGPPARFLNIAPGEPASAQTAAELSAFRTRRSVKRSAVRVPAGEAITEERFQEYDNRLADIMHKMQQGEKNHVVDAVLPDSPKYVKLPWPETVAEMPLQSVEFDGSKFYTASAVDEQKVQRKVSHGWGIPIPGSNVPLSSTDIFLFTAKALAATIEERRGDAVEQFTELFALRTDPRVAEIMREHNRSLVAAGMPGASLVFSAAEIGKSIGASPDVQRALNTAASFYESLPGYTWRFTYDLIGGAGTLPWSTMYGATETVRGLLKTTVEATNWIDENMPQLSTLATYLNSGSSAVLDYYNQHFTPLPPITDTYTEQVLRPIMTVVASAKLGGLVLKPFLGGLSATGAATPFLNRSLPMSFGAFITANPQQGNISSKIEELFPGSWISPLTSNLAMSPDNSPLGNRARAAIEAAGVGEGLNFLGQGAKYLARWVVSTTSAPAQLAKANQAYGYGAPGMIDVKTASAQSTTWMHPSASAPKTVDDVLVPIQGAARDSSRGFRREVLIAEGEKTSTTWKPRAQTHVLDEHPIGTAVTGGTPTLQGSSKLHDIYTVMKEQEKIVFRDLTKGVKDIENATVDGVELMSTQRANALVRGGAIPSQMNIMTGRILVENEQASAEVARMLGTQYRVISVANNLDGGAGPLRTLRMQIDLGNGASSEVQIIPSKIAGVMGKPGFDVQKHAQALTNAWDDQMKIWTKPSAPVQGMTNTQAVETMRGTTMPGMERAQSDAALLIQTAKDYKDMAGFVRLELGDDAVGTPARTSDIWINFNKIRSPDDIKSVIAQITDKYAPTIKADIGVHRDKQIVALAERVGMTTEDLLAKTGPLTDSEVIANRMLLDSAARTVKQLAEKAMSPTSSIADQWNFRVMEGHFLAIAQHTLKLRAESARSLRAWSIPVGSDKNYVDAARALMAQNGRIPYGSGGVEEANRKIAEYTVAMLTANPGGYPHFAANTLGAKGGLALDMIRESFQMSFLWGVRTHVRNFIGNTAMLSAAVADRYSAAKIGNLLGTAYDDRVNPDEAVIMMHSIMTNLHSAVANAGRNLMRGESAQAAKTIGGTTTADWGGIHSPKISTSHVSRTLGHTPQQATEFSNSLLGRFMDVTGEVIRVPGAMLQFGDDTFKSLAFEAQLQSLIHRQVTNVEKLTGAAAVQRAAELYTNRPEAMTQSAVQFAQTMTFQNQPGWIGKNLMNFRESGTLNPLVFVFPYLRTPINVTAATMAHSPIAPIALAQWREAYRAGGSARDLALAQWTNGIIGFSLAMNMAAAGMVTGPSPTQPDIRETYNRLGILPNALHIDGKYIDLFQIEPMGGLFSIAGGLSDLMYRKEMEREDMNEVQDLVAGVIGLMSRTSLEKTWFTGAAALVGGITGSANRGDAALIPLWRSITTGLLPGSSAFGMVNELIDPTAPKKQVIDPWSLEGIQERITKMRDRLPNAVDAWGDEIVPPQMFDGAIGSRVGTFIPVRMSELKDNPIDKELLRHGSGLRSIGTSVEIDGISVRFNAESRNVFNDLRRMIGSGKNMDGELVDSQYADKNGLRSFATIPMPDGRELGAKDYFNAMLAGTNDHMPLEQYKTLMTPGKEGTQVAWIRNTYNQVFKQRAIQVIMDPNYRKGDPEFEAFRAKVNTEKDRVNMIKTPQQYQEFLIPNAERRQ